MMNDSKRRLRIPVKFVTNLKDSHKLLGPKILTGPSGTSWLVEVKRTEDGDYVLCNDWEIFVKDHGLEDADLLVFKMNDFTSFDVMIFDATASNEENGYGDDDIHEPIRRKGKQSSRGKQYQFHSPQPSEGKKMKKILVAKQDNGKSKCTPSSSRKKNVEPNSEEISLMFSNRRQVPEKEKIRVHGLASRQRSSVPCVLMTMQPTHVYMGQMVFSKVSRLSKLTLVT
ncbi:hypothetical protein RND71_011491 [Anisodus tanguticus]|uniref:TF-B3 domain-containing protein n=1 Tax=Anisodus tanguticus TaxID=243964 RepID=A0AAE1SDU8_9SOLA|nr:hypothetical protein RND71_011491 [Anisodus tanguticus]